MSVLGNICLAECLSLVALAFRVPRGSYKCAVSSIACLLDICRAVEAVVADDRLGHSHFTSFLDDESAFLIEACNSDDIRISCLNLCQLCREVCIFISESFSIYDIDAQLLEYVLINLVFADHLVIVVGVHDSNGLEAKLVISFLYSNRNCEFAWDSITENVVAKIGDARSCGAGTKGNDLGLLGNGTCSKHFARCHRTFNSEDFILFNALLDSIDCFCLVQLGIVSYEIDLHLCLRIFVDFFDSKINAFLHSLAVSCAGACICSYKSEFNCLSCCAALGSFLVSAASCKCTGQCCCCHDSSHSLEPFLLHNVSLFLSKYFLIPAFQPMK